MHYFPTNTQSKEEIMQTVLQCKRFTLVQEAYLHVSTFICVLKLIDKINLVNSLLGRPMPKLKLLQCSLMKSVIYKSNIYLLTFLRL